MLCMLEWVTVIGSDGRKQDVCFLQGLDCTAGGLGCTASSLGEPWVGVGIASCMASCRVPGLLVCLAAGASAPGAHFLQ